MNVLKVSGALLLLLAGGVVIGSVPVALIGGRGERRGRCFAGRALLVGTFLCLLAFALLVAAAAGQGRDVSWVFRIWRIVMCISFAAALLLILCLKSVRGFWLRQIALLKRREWRRFFGALLVCYVCLAGTYALHPPLLGESFDLPERVATMRDAGRFGGVNPLTGEPAEETGTLRTAAGSVLPAWYLFYMRLFRMELWDMLFKAAPLWVLALCMSVYYELGAAVCGRFWDREEPDRRLLVYMAFFTLFTLCGNGAYMNPSYGLLHCAYEESTLVDSVLLPAAFAALLGIHIPQRRKQED